MKIKRSIIDDLVKHKTVILILVAVVAGFRIYEYRLSAQETAQACSIKEIGELRKSCNQSNTDIAVMKTDLCYVKGEVDKTSKNIEDIKNFLIKRNR